MRKLLPGTVAIALAACSGGHRTSAPPAAVVLFTDDFASGEFAPDWQPRAASAALLEPTMSATDGAPAPCVTFPSVLGAAAEVASTRAFPLDQGLTLRWHERVPTMHDSAAYGGGGLAADAAPAGALSPLLAGIRLAQNTLVPSPLGGGVSEHFVTAAVVLGGNVVATALVGRYAYASPPGFLAIEVRIAADGAVQFWADDVLLHTASLPAVALRPSRVVFQSLSAHEMFVDNVVVERP